MKPTIVERILGTLKVRSGSLALGDPHSLPFLEGLPGTVVPHVDVPEVVISARLWQYPTGGERVGTLLLRFGSDQGIDSRRKVGEVGIDSAKLVVGDKADLEEHWAHDGPDRLGVISTARNKNVLRMLTKRFKLKTVQVNPVRAEVVGPVSDALESEIENYLKSFPEYATHTFINFRVETNNSFQRLIHVDESWDFIPVGNADKPLMFVCTTGFGDGSYDVECAFAGNEPRVLTVDFLGEDDD